jgi:hypothetical protein
LISEPARPQTSTAPFEDVPVFDEIDPAVSPTVHSFMSAKPTLIRNESRASTLLPEPEVRPSILESLSSWLPWSKPGGPAESSFQGRTRNTSHAEGSLRDLLKSADFDKKGKGVDRSG